MEPCSYAIGMKFALKDVQQDSLLGHDAYGRMDLESSKVMMQYLALLTILSLVALRWDILY